MGVITNVTYEHLDYHGTWKNYLKAKARLFNGVKWAILNRDDASYKYLKSQITSNQSRVVTYSLKRKADLTPRAFKFKTNLLGEFNLYNCLAAISAVKILGIPDKKIRQSLLSFEPVSGRLEEIDEGQDFKIFIDFAHTPNAFRQILPALKKITQGKIIHVFGCTGDRERTKRPIMGEISAKFSDKIILTHEDTYSEDPKKIIAEIEPGVEKGGKILAKNYWKIEDRREAIKKAIEMAEKGDIVLVTGVGHQNSLNIGGKEISWSDQKEVRKILEK